MLYIVPPSSLEVDGEFYKIDSDFLTALSIMQMYNDKALSVSYKHMCMLEMLYSYVDESGEVVVNIPKNKIGAIEKGIWFLNGGKEEVEETSPKPRLMDFEKDYHLLISGINKSISRDIRFDENRHWWTFMGFCQELDEDSLISNVISIRSKLAKGGESKLESYEKEFYRENKEMIDICYDPLNKEELDKFLEEEKERVEKENELLRLNKNEAEFDKAVSSLKMTPEEFMSIYSNYK